MVNSNHIFEYMNDGNKEMITLLHLSVIKDRKDIISLLCHNGADRQIKNNSGMSPEDLALIQNKIEILELLQDL